MRICFLILNPFDFDSRARLICNDIIENGWSLDIIATEGGMMSEFRGARIHRVKQNIKPFKQRRFLEYNLRAAGIASRLECDIIHAVDLDTLWAAVNASKSNGAKVLYEARELYVELLAVHDRPIVKAFWTMLEKRLIHEADTVITINDSIAGELVERYNIPQPIVVRNVAESSRVTPVDLRGKYNLDCKYLMVYQGVLRPGQGISRSLELIRDVADTGLVIFGDGPYRNDIEKKLEQYGITARVRLAGMIPPDKLADYTAGGDCGFLLMEPVARNNYLALPQKIFQYIESGIAPIVTNIPELRKVIETDDLGLVLDNKIESDDRTLLQSFLEKDLARTRRNCKLIKGKYSWKSEGGLIINAYKGLIEC